MDKITALYPQVVEQTKKKIHEDLDSYFETKAEMPSFEQYITDRKMYLEQIWVNVWLNKATNSIPKLIKKDFLKKKGYVVEGVDKKLINRLFRNEIRDYCPFDVFSWVNQRFSQDGEEWKERYEKVRLKYLSKQEEERERQRKWEIQFEIEKQGEHIIQDNIELFYLQLRYKVACLLAADLKQNTKYKLIDAFQIEEKLTPEGNFNSSNYTTLSTFFYELTGVVHKLFDWEYETYYYKYERIIYELTAEIVVHKIKEDLPEFLFHQFENVFGKPLSDSKITSFLSDRINDLCADFFTEIENEYISDLLFISAVPFEVTVHKSMYEEQVETREQRKAQELAEIEKKKIEEERMIDDIFGREYRPNIGRKIQYILHIGETNTGKTHHALEKMKSAETGIYLAPLRLLALEVYDKLKQDGVSCGLKTGEEEKEVETASHLSCTVEMFYEKDYYEVVVIDEAQMIADKDRGFSWYKAITKANAKEVHIIGSRSSESMILQLLGDSDITIHHYYRDIPLQVEGKEFSMKHTSKGDALVCFSRRKVLETASKLQQNGYSVSMIYGSMPPETRKKQMHRFISGETNVIVATDAIGMGLNLPIRRIVFLENEKFDGVRKRRLSSQEIKQIAGRAGRKGIYNVGKVAFTKEIKLMKRLLEKEDTLISSFAIAPTTAVFERFQKYSRNLGVFFDLWQKFESPHGTKKASLAEERELYATIKDTEIEARLSMLDLYGFLHLPFSTKEPKLMKQWRETMMAIIKGKELPEPIIKRSNLEEAELAYKAVGLHLLFLYRLNRGTEALYWERVRTEISDEVHERLKNDISTLKKECRQCGKKLSLDFEYAICDHCHGKKYRRKYYDYDDDYDYYPHYK
ncbi:helicase-related protein [Alkalihalobacterium bogoriense]|uniref:helicase-related protein n=1 Tax=Alkalihalobacterium bogoriense TaxID=246272 RepID=UPI00047B1BB3|nr:helicase-related protein [Alkalihalobacterium bogoriense]